MEPILVVFDFDQTLVRATHQLLENLALADADPLQIALKQALNDYLKIPEKQKRYTQNGIPQWTMFNDINTKNDIGWQNKIIQALMDDDFWDKHPALGEIREKYQIKFNFPNAKNLIEETIDAGHYLGVGTGNIFIGLVEGFLEKALPKYYTRIHVHSEIINPDECKQPHIKAIKKHFSQKTGVEFPNYKILLIDDDEKNIGSAIFHGYETFFFPTGNAEYIANYQPYQKITEIINMMAKKSKEPDAKNDKQDVTVDPITPTNGKKRDCVDQYFQNTGCVKKRLKLGATQPDKDILSAIERSIKAPLPANVSSVEGTHPLSPFSSPGNSPSSSPQKLPLQNRQNTLHKIHEHLDSKSQQNLSAGFPQKPPLLNSSQKKS